MFSGYMNTELLIVRNMRFLWVELCYRQYAYIDVTLIFYYRVSGIIMVIPYFDYDVINDINEANIVGVVKTLHNSA